MKSFSISNYRSISKKCTIELNDYTVLVGKNNEGKTNLLHGLGVAIDLISQSRNPMRSRINYEYNHSKNSTDDSIEFVLNYDFDESDTFAFKTLLGIPSVDNVSVRIVVEPDNKVKYYFPRKKSPIYKERYKEILEFLSNKTVFNIIPTIRTEDTSRNVIDSIISIKLDQLYETEEYRNALDTVTKMENRVLDEVSKSILKPMREFVPAISSINISRYQGWRRKINCELSINDGVLTKIEDKGEGVKNLVAISILKEQYLTSGSIIAIEEPESHLHPSAIHRLSKTIKDLSKNSQVIITTHNPLFIERVNIKSNIIVDGGIARPAEGIEEIREVLGVVPSDNLINAALILLVEGNNDERIISSIITKREDRIKECMDEGTFKIVSIGGVSNLSYNLNLLENMCYTCCVLLDDDEEALTAVRKAIESNLIDRGSVFLTSTNRKQQSEIEDCIPPEIYINELNNTLNTNIKIEEIESEHSKWSVLIEKLLQKHGKMHNEGSIQEAKRIVVECVEQKEFDSYYNGNKSIPELFTYIRKTLGS